MADIVVNGDSDENSWINENFFMDLLKLEKNPNVTIKILNISNAVPTGNNYLGVVWRVDTEIFVNNDLSKRQSFIIKDFPKGDALKKFMRESGIFDKEFNMYTNMLPNLYNIARDKLPSSIQEPISPLAYITTREETLVLEDLRPLGYKMADRLKGLDFEHCVAVLKTLAKLHALSISLATKDDSVMDDFNDTMFVEEKKERSRPFIEKPMLQVADIVEKWDGYERFGKKLRVATGSAFDKLIYACGRDNSRYCVLNHGDLWVNNILFRYSSTGDISGVKFVDYQMSRFASFALDLHYFFTTSLSDDVREYSVEKLLQVYHNELCTILCQLGCESKVITLEELKQEMEDKLFFCLFTAMNVLPIIVADPGDTPDFSTMKEEDYQNDEGANPTEKAINGSRYKKILQKILIRLEESGVL